MRRMAIVFAFVLLLAPASGCSRPPVSHQVPTGMGRFAFEPQPYERPAGDDFGSGMSVVASGTVRYDGGLLAWMRIRNRTAHGYAEPHWTAYGDADEWQDTAVLPQYLPAGEAVTVLAWDRDATSTPTWVQDDGGSYREDGDVGPMDSPNVRTVARMLPGGKWAGTAENRSPEAVAVRSIVVLGTDSAGTPSLLAVLGGVAGNDIIPVGKTKAYAGETVFDGGTTVRKASWPTY